MVRSYGERTDEGRVTKSYREDVGVVRRRGRLTGGVGAFEVDGFIIQKCERVARSRSNYKMIVWRRRDSEKVPGT